MQRLNARACLEQLSRFCSMSVTLGALLACTADQPNLTGAAASPARTTPVTLEEFKSRPSSWMKYVSDAATLKDICMPGSHDAGMFDTTNIFSNLAVTQNLQFDGQLAAGVRFFDVRLQWWDDEDTRGTYFHHGDATGPWFDTQLYKVWEFVHAHPSETVILSFSDFKSFSDEPRYDRLLARIKYMLAPYLLNIPTKGRHVSTMPLRDLRGKVIVRSADSGFEKAAERAGVQGVISQDYVRIFDRYANERSWTAVSAHQLKEFNKFHNAEELFMLNWTETPLGSDVCDAHFSKWFQPLEYASCQSLILSQSVRSLTADIKPHLLDRQTMADFFQRKDKAEKVNIINEDFVGGDTNTLQACYAVMEPSHILAK